MKRAWAAVAAACALALLVLQPAQAQRPGELSFHGRPVLPEGRMGERLQSLLQTLNSGSPHRIRRFFSEDCDENLRNLAPMDHHMGANDGFGFIVTQGPEGRVVGHSGGFSGINSQLDIYLDSGFVVAVMSNINMGGSPLARAIRRIIGRIQPRS